MQLLFVVEYILDEILTLMVIVVPPSQPSLTLPNFQENTATSIQCRVSAVKPGVGSVVFTVTVDPDFSIQSSDSDLSEGSADVTTGAVSVTYSPQISLQRKHNGQQALCTVVWRDGKKTVTSEIKTVDVICKYFIYYIVNLLQRKHNEQQAVHNSGVERQ